MKINDQSSINPADLGGAAAARPRTGAAAPSTEAASSGTNPAATPAARVELSARGRELAEARRLADAAPDVRADVVADARERIANGTYHPDPARIARRIVDRRA